MRGSVYLFDLKVICCVMVLAVGVSTLVSAQGRSYSSPLVIPAADFSDTGFASHDGYEFWPAMGYLKSLGFHNLKAPVYLPNGATITGVTAVLYDNVSGINMQVAMFRCNRTTGDVDRMTLIYSPTSAAIQEVPNPDPITNPVVSYPDYWYYVVVEFAAADQRLYAVRVDYTE
ncbi:MAG: hypothetical protein K8R59_12450 [Thermoanaerobaculales bacterium]|nr:hypothetical protein [Thermoanaerobaculales bacterium]